VFEIYVGLIPDRKERTSTACTARWGTINQGVTKFCSLFAQVTSVPKSGLTEDKYRPLKKLWSCLNGRKKGKSWVKFLFLMGVGVFKRKPRSRKVAAVMFRTNQN